MLCIYSTMAETQSRHDCKSRAALYCVVLTVCGAAAAGQIRYSIPEEMQKGSFVGNIAQDLGLEAKALSERGVRVVSRGRMQYFALDLKNGHLYMNERVDREETCGHIAKCVLNVEILVENPVKLYRSEVEIQDINDNSPTFPENESVLEIMEYTAPGTRFPLEKAHDSDVGLNSLQKYVCSENDYFILNVKTGDDGVKYPELILQKYLDREQQAVHNLILTATDGGNPIKSGSTVIRIQVLDGNDNVPEFTQSVYKVNVKENVPVGSVVLRVKATDKDEGTNAQIRYSFLKILEKFNRNFKVDSETGDITVMEKLDFEEMAFYELDIQARDEGGLSAHSKVLIQVVDINNHVPEITVNSVFTPVAEDSQIGAVIAIFNVQDRDSGDNGEIICSIPDNLPFKLQRSFDDYYSLVTARGLDREQVADYNVTVTARDRGAPPLWSATTIAVQVSDVNDNAPAFSQAAYSVWVSENNARGASVFCARAADADWGDNARVTYWLAEGELQGAPLSSWLSVQAESGAVHALRALDYEQVREIRFAVEARDGGSPPLRSSASVTLLVLDQNDNRPEILYPAAPRDGSTGVELAPRSAEPGYLVTKVVAVDADAGQNAWLSYELLKASEPGLFALGVHTGEIRTARALGDRDALKHRLVVGVRDNGQPPLSASVTLTVAVADSIPELLADLGSLAAPAAEAQASLTLYLVVAVAAVSCLFLAFLIVLLGLRLRRWRQAQLLGSAGGALAGVPVSHFAGIDGVRAFLHSYSQDVSLTAGSRKSQLRFSTASCPSTLTGQQESNKSGPLLIVDVTNVSPGDRSFAQQAQPNTDWRFSQAQRPGTSGSQNGEEGGAWPNNQFDTEMLQAMIMASANEAADGNSTLGGGTGTMGLSARYGPQFTLQHVPDYRQNVYIPGSTATLSNSSGKRDAKSSGSSGGNKKKSGKKEKK
ncbi:protocadherin gamma-A4 isoform X8 [Alligator mississippiensis]|uniref:protocadherin gamma-A4 isoform X8 n=1 Tax=Alligator mississippiensis TaxID=8496 RepID=UPI002877A1A5|nr:protocadherin gamma-A4 isoform X8 [Alligator mississippiensis]